MARNFRNRSVKQTVALVGDGQTERIYFANVRDTDRPQNLSVFPDYPRKIGNYKGVLAKAVELKEQGYDRVYALIDMDKVIDEYRLDEYRQEKRNAEQSSVIVLENNPCFEVWILLHFISTGKLFANCTEVVTELKRRSPITNYDKGERFLINANLYKNYKMQLLNNAMPNAIDK